MAAGPSLAGRHAGKAVDGSEPWSCLSTTVYANAMLLTSFTMAPTSDWIHPKDIFHAMNTSYKVTHRHLKDIQLSFGASCLNQPMHFAVVVVPCCSIFLQDLLQRYHQRGREGPRMAGGLGAPGALRARHGESPRRS